MPWPETDPMKEREKFARDLCAGMFTMTALCERYGVSRKTGYKWRDRLFAEGLEGMTDRSRAPRSCPHVTPVHLQQLILDEKRKHPNWGGPKLLKVLRKKYPNLELPADSTAGALLRKHGLTRPKRRRKKWKHPGVPTRRPSAPNELWTADFKGQFKTKDGAYCYPLTIADQHSRYLLACTGLPSVKTVDARPVFTRLFRDVGLPDAIRTDNGAPFCSSNAIHGLCELNVWWLQLGIHHERTQPSSPQQNGAHERMHRTLKRDTTRPPASSMRGQQRKFDRFRAEYNEERPHDFLDGDMPAEHWAPSQREYPRRLPKPEYPDGLMVRKVSKCGTFRLNNAQPFISNALAELYIAIEEVDDGLWAIYFYDHLLAHYEEQTRSWFD